MPEKEQNGNNEVGPGVKSTPAASEMGNPPENKTRPIPLPEGTIQVNRCKTPGCVNFGVAPSLLPQKKGAGKKSSDGYKVSGDGTGRANIICQHCNKSTRLKSNKAVAEEFRRQGRHLFQPSPIRCPNPACANHDPQGHPADLFRRHGVTRDGSPRFCCRICGRTMSVKGPTHKQRRTDANSSIFRHLVNKTPFSRLCELEDISFSSLYGKIEFIYRQCALFAAAREAKLPSMDLGERSLATDKQDYIVNWGDRAKRETIQLTAVATADVRSGYVFGFTLNFDPDLTPQQVEAMWRASGDAEKKPHMRELARVWTMADYMASRQKSPPMDRALVPRTGEFVDVNDTVRPDLEVPEVVIEGQQLPKTGVQVHADYLVHGHYHLLRHLMRGASKLNLFVDAEAGMLTACMGAFADWIAEQRADVVQVRITKDLTVDERRTLMAKTAKVRAVLAENFPEMSDWEIKIDLMRRIVGQKRKNSPLPSNRLQNLWLADPLPNGAEPDKTMRFVTDIDHLSDTQAAMLLARSTLWPIDTVFNMIRRRVAMFERPVQSVRRARRMWHIYAAYDPERVVQMLEIFRVWYNYLWRGDDDRTPAEKLGLTVGKVRMDHILGYDLRNLANSHFDQGR